MAILRTPIRGHKTPSYGARVVVRVSRGRAIFQKWPRKRGKITNATTLAQMALFKERNILAKYAPGEDQWIAIEVAKNSPLYPRDLLMSAMAGRLFERLVVDGKVYTSVAVRDDISADLDLIGGELQGTLLVRGPDIWQALIPAVAGQVLTSNGLNVLPSYQAGGAGGGDFFVQNEPSTLATTGAFATKGNAYGILEPTTIKGMGCMLTPSITDTYQGRIWSLDGTPALVALVGDTGPLTFTTAVRQPVFAPLLTPASLAAGTGYYFAWSKTNGTGINPIPLHGTVGTARLPGLPISYYFFNANAEIFVNLAVANPVPPQAITLSGGGSYSQSLTLAI